MKKTLCDVCGEEIPEGKTVRIGGAIRDIARAEEICDRCAAACNRIDWPACIRREIMREAVRNV